jgi:hypothetical protein
MKRPPLIASLRWGGRSPPFTDRSLRERADSHHSVLREWPFGSIPGDVLLRPCAVPESSPCALLEPVCRCPDRSPRAHRGQAVVLALVSSAWRPGPGCRLRVCAVQPLENSKASTSIFVLQATKSQRRMPWRLRPKKDVGDCEKPREAVYRASIRGYPNGATQHLS